MNAGEAISFMVAFSTTDYLPFNDTGALGIFDFTNFAGTTLFTQSVSSVGDGVSGPWTKVTFVAPVTGSYAINASVRNVGDGSVNSFLLLDAPAVPEPGAWMLMLLGLGVVGFGMRRRPNLRVNFA
ncbi:MAG: PEP-CTERM sorting domain-containing protein [Sphingomonadales bacterium]|nr:PEP-CTERM sorting domain-containing protein [Sphingomonadales bacterium]